MMQDPTNETWPLLPYEQFQSTGHLLHMATQVMGKLKLATPFEAHWANVVLFITVRGLTTGIIPYRNGVFSIDVDMVSHCIICMNSWGGRESFPLKSMSVAELTQTLLDTLVKIGISATINPKPQEIPEPILFHEDTELRAYDSALASAWWRILFNSYQVLQRYHARFTGASPAVGFMWGTFDLRDARYINTPVPTTGVNSGYIRRNAMDVAQVEAGWWSGNASYPRPAYYSFMYPAPSAIENAKIKPDAARWDSSLGEFILDYDDLRKSKDPARDLLDFWESTYAVEASLAAWDPKLIGAANPI